MQKIISNLSWIIDYYFVYFLYNERKLDRYYIYMKQKWGNKFTDKIN